MADKLHFSLVSPERQLMSKEVDQVDIPASEGQWGVLPNHSPAMATLAPGIVRIIDGGETTNILVGGGFAEITPAGLTVLAEDAVPVAELDAAAITARIETAEQDMAAEGIAPEARRHAELLIQNLKEIETA